MAVSKIVFSQLSTTSLPYTAIGGIRFYDKDGNQIDVLGSSIIRNELTTFETDKVLITVTDAYSNADNYYIGNAFRNDRPQTGGFGDKHYWLSSKDNQTITVEFKTPLTSLSKIEFNPRPDSTYTNRGIDQPFNIDVYDESGNLIISYKINPNYTTVNKIQVVNTPELSIKKYILFADTSEDVYYYDTGSSKFQDLSKTKSDLTKDDFINYGLQAPIKLNKTKLLELGTQFEILVYSEDGATSGSAIINYIPNDQLVVQKELINIGGYDKINSITINSSISGSGEIKVAISRDLTNWYIYDTSTSSWKLIKSGALDINNKDDINLILTKGNIPSEINSLTWSEYENLYKDKDGNVILDNIAFAFALSKTNYEDEVKISSIVINATPKPLWKDVTNNCTILQGYSTIQVTFSLDGDFKVNYIDGDVSSSAESKSSSLTEIDGGSSSG